ncbi:MAG: UDP-N-acetylmuramate dehydrogenase, partial [Candidatus Berkelbacteria bacterium Licking1014_85]
MEIRNFKYIPMKIALKNLMTLKIQENIPLAPYTTFKIGGPAKYFFIAQTREDIINAIETAQELKLPYYILGGGSNLLVSDNGYDGLVIKVATAGCCQKENMLLCEAGLSLSQLIMNAQKVGLGGMEFMAGIPGTVGGAVYGNAGAWGREFGELVQEADIYKEGQIKKLSQADLGFVYRGCALKKSGGVILNIAIMLIKRRAQDIQKEVVEII